MRAKKHILVVDDHVLARKHLSALLKETFEIYEAVDAESCKQLLKQRWFNLIILDLLLPDVEGLELLRFIKDTYPAIPIIMITSSEEVPLAVRALGAGASDYILKSEIANYPERILVSIQQHLIIQDLKKSNHALIEERKSQHLQFLIPTGTVYEQIYDKATKVVQAGLSLMILGETGMGKDILSKYIHHTLFPEKPMIPIDCGAICHSISDSELFGHEVGAFTDAKNVKKGKFELADQGLLFLDELGNMSLDIQAKLLRVIEDKMIVRLGSTKPISVAFSVICATNKNLKEAIQKGTFREDLYYRLNQFEITIPPLREHPHALQQWIYYFVDIYIQKYRVDFVLPDNLKEYWLAHQWPGNIRELKSEIQQTIFKYSIGESLDPSVYARTYSKESSNFSLKAAEKQVFIDRLTDALRETQYNVSKASKLLGIPRTTLISRMDRHGIGITDLQKK